MLGADVVMVETPSLIHRQHDTVTAPNDKFDRTADFVEFHTEIAEHLGRDPVALADQTQQQMLGADIIMVEALGFFLCEAQHLASPLRKLIKSFFVVHKKIQRRTLTKRSERGRRSSFLLLY